MAIRVPTVDAEGAFVEDTKAWLDGQLEAVKTDSSEKDAAVVEKIGFKEVDPSTGYSFAVLDNGNQIGELALDLSGEVPQWVLDRWASRLESPLRSLGIAGSSAEPSTRRAALVSSFLTRRGGRIGTGGKTVVCLRFDHGLTTFKSKILPLLRERGLPSMNTMNSRTWDESSNSGMTPSELQAAWLNDCVEVCNHAATHKDAATETAIRDEILNGLGELQSQLPNSPIEGYCPPGAGGTRFMGFNGGDSTESWSSTLAGQLIVSNHAAVFGYLPGIYRPQGVDLQIGAPHTTIDQQDSSWVGAVVRGAISAKPSALTLMFHPVYLDQEGYLSTSELTAILDDLVARRDSGEILVTTPTGSLALDPTHNYRHDLISNPDLEGGTPQTSSTPSGWSGNPWYVRADGSVSAGSPAYPLSQKVNLSRLSHFRGGNREFVVNARGLSEGEVLEVTVTDGGSLNTTRNYPLSTIAKNYYLPFSIPMNSTELTFTFRKSSTGSGSGVAVFNAHCYSI